MTDDANQFTLSLDLKNLSVGAPSSQALNRKP
jgi:hypothetical protein